MAQAPSKDYTTEQVRNIALIGHGGSGKTTLSEALLFTGGIVNRFGKVDDGSTVSDYHPDEIEGKISINTSLLNLDWLQHKLNILDTPGYSDFTGEVIAALRVADGAFVLVKAVEGTEVGTEIVWGYAKALGIPAALIVNKLDNENADFDKAVASMKDRFGNDVTVVQFPVNAGLPFDAIVDVMRMKLLRFERDGSGKFTEADIPADLKGKADQLHEELVEKIAEADESLLDKFLEGGTLPPDELNRGFQLALRDRKIFPVFCAASSMNIGTPPILDLAVHHFPSPRDRGPARKRWHACWTATSPLSENAVTLRGF